MTSVLTAIVTRTQPPAPSWRPCTPDPCRSTSIATPVRSIPITAGEPGNRVEVGLLGVLGEAVNGHVVDHTLPKLCHRASPSWSDRSRRHARALACGRDTRQLSISRGERGPDCAPRPRAHRLLLQLACCREIIAKRIYPLDVRSLASYGSSPVEET